MSVAGAGVGMVLSACGGVSNTASPAPPPRASQLTTLSSAQAVDVLQQTWQSYVRTFIRSDGHVVDPSSGDTTSEGQSYAMLRAVWMDDRLTFDTVWTWTQQHLWHDGRFAYLWNGAVLDTNSATDADQDIALALVFAAHRWQDASYASSALQVLDSVWENDVTMVGGVAYVDAGSWAARGDAAGPVLDPSYFAPYAYRIFAAADTGHPWGTLVASSYQALNACSQAPLGSVASAGLPPDWCVLNRGSRSMQSFPEKSGADDYGYDAFRVMWRVALDGLWFGSAQALMYLASQTFLRSQWTQHGSLAAVYSHAGSPRTTYDDPTVYGGDIGAFLSDASLAAAVLQQKLLASVHSGGGQTYFGDANNYYEQNWVWFGVALATGRLSNLAAAA